VLAAAADICHHDVHACSVLALVQAKESRWLRERPRRREREVDEPWFGQTVGQVMRAYTG